MSDQQRSPLPDYTLMTSSDPEVDEYARRHASLPVSHSALPF
jgi:hypothetical protein